MKLILLCLTLTCPITIVLSLLLKYSEIWGTEIRKRRFVVIKRRETRERKCGYAMSMAIIALTSGVVGQRVYYEACVEGKRVMADWVFTFIVGYLLELTVFDILKHSFKQLLVALTFKLKLHTCVVSAKVQPMKDSQARETKSLDTSEQTHRFAELKNIGIEQMCLNSYL
eukprot:TRINITY_DN1116_c0_g1_i7.p1 TRINITY_DN1116_c0_g1~~TRINITY_DN1116_c0_g1_i7.p1  ORF type:complete len:170 (+),score=2.16 TRINITY_DN1116_c0_g1_i7:107-616(+)